MELTNDISDSGIGGATEERPTVVVVVVVVDIDRDKNSQKALKWAIDNLLSKGQTVILIHVKIKNSVSNSPLPTPRMNQYSDLSDLPIICKDLDPQTKDLFLPFRCFCTRKDIQWKDVVLEESDVGKALIEYATYAVIEALVMGASAKAGFLRFKTTDVPRTVSKGVLDFCSIYIIAKGKVSSTRLASRSAPTVSPLRNQLVNQSSLKPSLPVPDISGRAENPVMDPPCRSTDSLDSFRSPFTRKGPNGRSYAELPMPESDILFVSSMVQS